MEEGAKENLFQKLFSINVNGHTEKLKNGSGKEFTYLTWSWAWAEFKKYCPDATYEIKRNPETDQHFWYDKNLGYEVRTAVTVDGVTNEMWLPVMDSANSAMKAEPYIITNKWGKKRTVNAATMFDINTAIMRCLVKNLAMFGFGLYIYAGEDLPDVEKEEKPKSEGNSEKEGKPKTEEKVPANVQPIAPVKEELATDIQKNTIRKLCASLSPTKPGPLNVDALYKAFRTTQETCTKEMAYKIMAWFKKQWPDLEAEA